MPYILLKSPIAWRYPKIRYLNFQYPVILRLPFGAFWLLSAPRRRKFLKAAVSEIEPVRDAAPDNPMIKNPPERPMSPEGFHLFIHIFTLLKFHQNSLVFFLF